MAFSDAVQMLERELREVFGSRLQSLVVYGQRRHAAGHAHVEGHSGQAAGHGHDAPATHTLAVVDSMTAADLRACAVRIDAWHGAGLATPLLIADHEFAQSLDAFPLEFGAILADHSVVAGSNPFDALSVDPADLRRACEVQARSHLLHLREGFLETRGRADALAVLIVRSAAAFAALVTSIARLEGQDARNTEQCGGGSYETCRRGRHLVSRSRASLQAVPRRGRADRDLRGRVDASWSLVMSRWYGVVSRLCGVVSRSCGVVGHSSGPPRWCSRYRSYGQLAPSPRRLAPSQN
jgi:hypothetical protein